MRKQAAVVLVILGMIVFLTNTGLSGFFQAQASDLEITPADDFEPSGPAGGPFTPSFKDYQLTNTGVGSLFWGVDNTTGWVDFDPTWGTLDPCESTMVAVYLMSDVNSFSEGVYTDTLTFTDITNGGDQIRDVNLLVYGPGVLEVTPAEDFEPTGQVGGPFAPSSKDYQLTNIGSSPINWTAAKTEIWLDLDPNSGALDPSVSTMVTVSLTSEADWLAEGIYADTLTFTNLNTAEEQTRGVTLSIGSVSVSPGSFDFEIKEGCTLTETLTLDNNGFEDLSFTIRTREISREIIGGLLAMKAPSSIVQVGSEDSISLKYSFSEPVISGSGGYDLAQITGLESYKRTGAPIVPVRPVRILVPFGKKVVGTRVILLGTRELPGTYTLPPAQEPQPLSYTGTVKRTKPDPAIYGQSTPWPGMNHEEVATQSKRGYQLFTVNLFPLQYTPATGKLIHTSRMRLEIDLADSTAANVLKPTEAARATLSNIVDNPHALDSYSSASTSAQKLGEMSTLPGGGPYKYVIITNGALEGASGPWNFQALRDTKIANGITATIVTTEWIYSTYDGTRPDGGSDNQTRIRNFLIDAYQTWDTEYVLLGGTNGIVPARKFWVSSHTSELETTTMPVDMYYGCVEPAECTFDNDADGSYGEPTDGVGGNDVDLYAEIYVGRATVENSTELANFIKKTLTYASTHNEYLPRISMVGEYLGFGGVAQYAKPAMEQIRLGGDYDGYFTYGFENHTQPDFYDFNTLTNLYDADGTWSKSHLLNLMNEGRHIFNHLGHANYTYDMKLYTSDLSSLTNTDYFFAYSQGCMPGGFDTSNCFAEVITSMEYGAFAVVMNARYGWGTFNSTDGPSQRFARQFWDAALNEDMLEMGRANQDSKEDNLWDINGGCIRWCYYELNLFGDPQQELRFEEACQWIAVDPEAGTVGSGDSNDISVTFDAMTLVPGTYEAEIVIISNDAGSPRIIPVTMTVLQDDLQVLPAEGLESSGTEGGPFEPASKVYTLTNIGTGAVNWTTLETEDWLEVIPYDGILGVGESIDVNVCFSANAASLDPNVYTQILMFQNADSNSIKPRPVTLTVKPPDCFTESFEENSDLEDLSVTFSPDGSIAYYEACREKTDEFPVDPNGGTFVGLGDDDFIEVAFANDVNVWFYGVSYDRVYIGSNGYITFGDGDTQFSGTLEYHFGMPRISGMFTDLTPPDNQCISYKQLEDSIVVTFKDVPLYGDKNTKNSFQIEIFFADGTICITWLDVEATAFVAGLSRGIGLMSEFFVESELDEYPPCWPWCDFDRDYIVNFTDFAVMAVHWLDVDCNIPYWCGKADLSFDGVVATADLGIFAEDWLTEIEQWWLWPVSHWKFDEGTGDIAYDWVGDNDGTLVGDPAWVAGKIGTHALDFNGVSDYVECTNDPSLNFGVGDFTIAFWIRTTKTANQWILQKFNYTPSLSRGYRIIEYNNYIEFETCEANTKTETSFTASLLTDGEWHHLVATRERETVSLWLDGAFQSSNSGPIRDVDTPDDLIVGMHRDAAAHPVDGTIDDVLIYDRALSDEEIQQLYEEGRSYKATIPEPADGAMVVDPNTALTWWPGKDVVSHDVYLGTTFDDVNDANTADPNVYMGNFDVNSFDPCGLDLETSYFWRIDEVGDSNTYKGDVWSFTTWKEFDPNLNLVSWWEFEEGSGSTAGDSSGTNDGILVGEPTWVAGKIGAHALEFDGDGDYVEIPDDDSLTPFDQITIAYWIYKRSGQHAGIFKSASCPNESNSPGNSRAYIFYINDNTSQVVFRIFSSVDNYDTVTRNYIFSPNQWHHIAATFDQGDTSIYIDGQSDGASTMSVNSIMNDAQPLIIGGYWDYCGTDNFANCLDGKIDDVRIYDVALNSGEIQQLYEAGL